jgi:choline dehydrogenase/5-(hydroxymethyl)furfural/furfural oxidase
VADASVFPEVPRANTNLPTIAAAERLSDLIRDAAAPPDRIGAESVPTPAGS